MKKQNKLMGFTLIELLAVIVILAIIVLIATPIVLNIIEDSRERAFKQTGNGIIDAAEYYYMNEMSDGVKPTEEKKFTFDGSKNGLEGLEFDGEIPKAGSLTVNKEGKVQLVAHNNQYCITKGYAENEVTIKAYDGNCELPKVLYTNGIMTSENSCIKTGNCENGTPVSVNVNDTTTYNFYVLSSTSNDITLIMDQNINSDGSIPAKGVDCGYNDTDFSDKICDIIGWNGFTQKGPTALMPFLVNATKDWINVSPLNYEYYDTIQETEEFTDFAYTSFIAKEGIVTITARDGNESTYGSASEQIRARIPIVNEVSEYNVGANNLYLFTGLHYGCSMQKGEYTCTGIENSTNISNVYSYWTLSSKPDLDGSYGARVNWNGFIVGFDGARSGVRPVITLEI